MPAIVSAPNIGKVLGQRLRAVGIDSRETLAAEVLARIAKDYPAQR